MIRKTLIVTLVEKDEHTAETHDIMQVSKGPSDGTIILFPLLQGKFTVNFNDLLDAGKEIEAFYSVAPAQKVAPAKSIDAEDQRLIRDLNKKAKKLDGLLKKEDYLAPSYGDDESDPIDD